MGLFLDPGTLTICSLNDCNRCFRTLPLHSSGMFTEDDDHYMLRPTYHVIVTAPQSRPHLRHPHQGKRPRAGRAPGQGCKLANGSCSAGKGSGHPGLMHRLCTGPGVECVAALKWKTAPGSVLSGYRVHTTSHFDAQQPWRGADWLTSFSCPQPKQALHDSIHEGEAAC